MSHCLIRCFTSCMLLVSFSQDKAFVSHTNFTCGGMFVVLLWSRSPCCESATEGWEPIVYSWHTQTTCWLHLRLNTQNMNFARMDGVAYPSWHGLQYPNDAGRKSYYSQMTDGKQGRCNMTYSTSAKQSEPEQTANSPAYPYASRPIWPISNSKGRKRTLETGKSSVQLLIKALGQDTKWKYNSFKCRMIAKASSTVPLTWVTRSISDPAKLTLWHQR